MHILSLTHTHEHIRVAQLILSSTQSTLLNTCAAHHSHARKQSDNNISRSIFSPLCILFHFAILFHVVHFSPVVPSFRKYSIHVLCPDSCWSRLFSSTTNILLLCLYVPEHQPYRNVICSCYIHAAMFVFLFVTSCPLFLCFCRRITFFFFALLFSVQTLHYQCCRWCNCNFGCVPFFSIPSSFSSPLSFYAYRFAWCHI